jgi:hypothetical protein
MHKNNFINFFINIWQHQKNMHIFATQNKNMQYLSLHIETANRFSPKGDYTGCGASIAAR